MHIDKKTIRYLFIGGIGCILTYWLLHETERFSAFWHGFTGILSPFVIGATLAFILNVPMRAIEKHLKGIKRDGLRRAVAIILTFVALLLVLIGVFVLLVPQITATVQSLIPKLTAFFQRAQVWTTDFLADHPEIVEYWNIDFASWDWSSLLQKLVDFLTGSMSIIATGAVSAVGSIAGGIVDTVIGLVFAVYSLGRKEILARQGRRLLYSLLPEKASDEIIRISRLANSTFSNFISGQCLEALILGSLFAVAMAIAGMPYIPLISVLIAVTALVPIVGAFIGCIVGAFFILVNDPMQAVVFVIMFLVLQQLENNLIYPRVVGESIGLPGMWVLAAVTVGGEIMGVAGMLLMIPLVSVLYTLAREFTTKRVAERQIDAEKLQDHPPELKSKFKEKREKRREQKLLKQMKELAEKHVHKPTFVKPKAKKNKK